MPISPPAAMPDAMRRRRTGSNASDSSNASRSDQATTSASSRERHDVHVRAVVTAVRAARVPDRSHERRRLAQDARRRAERAPSVGRRSKARSPR